MPGIPEDSRSLPGYRMVYVICGPVKTAKELEKIPPVKRVTK